MRRLSAIVRITIGLVGLLLSTLFLAGNFGLVPDDRAMAAKARVSMCESVALSSSALINNRSLAPLRNHLRFVLKRNPELKRIVIREQGGRVLVDVGEDETDLAAGQSIAAPITFPIYDGSGTWGAVEFFYPSDHKTGLAEVFQRTSVRLSVFVGTITFCLYYCFLRRVLQRLDPTKAVPDRVRSALNTLAEGLIILDEKERIVLANDAFSKTVHRKSEELIGRPVTELGWSGTADSPMTELPWVGSLKRGIEQNDIPLTIQLPGEEPRIFRVNSTPVFDSKGNSRGALATFNDVTAIEKNRTALRKMLEELCVSRDEIKRQNNELQILATRDPLTGCLNRRSFFEQFENHWSAATIDELSLSCAMVDIDHFKSINDRFGHAMGDKVLQSVGNALRKTAPDDHLVCRYGGEEFAVLMPNATLNEAAVLAEKIRIAVAELEFEELQVTTSIGVSARVDDTPDAHSLLNEADQCLYVAKRQGRNRVIRRDELTEDDKKSQAHAKTSRPSDRVNPSSISFRAVTALYSALAYRDHSTAEHNRRVADLVVLLANGLLTSSDIYVLEIAALLHDVGKLGVPDAILLKQAPLTPEEWQVMSRYDRIGVEIIHSAFGCDKLSDIVRCHHMWFNGKSEDPNTPQGTDIPLPARILQIADAYDAMVSDRVYRKARSQQEAFAELRRCAGTQFDPELVDRLIQVMQDQGLKPSPNVGPVDRQFALQIGTEIERLAATLDGRDLHGLESLASRLKTTASNNGVAEIADVAGRLEASAKENAGLESVFALTQELISLCRSTQRQFLCNSDTNMTISG